FPALTQFLSLDHRSLPVHWVCKPGSPCDIILLSPNHCTEELKFTFRILPWILKRCNSVSVTWTNFPTNVCPDSSARFSLPKLFA
ncbi:hypothetical protein CHARACLAT_031650, partial [Characodon lateralis]|nr:hypothetical protein [Characodon lateralis]